MPTTRSTESRSRDGHRGRQGLYVSAFGWSLVDHGSDYAGIQGDGKEAGGLRRDSEVHAGGPLVIIAGFRFRSTVGTRR
jgi:hypothetical protein